MGRLQFLWMKRELKTNSRQMERNSDSSEISMTVQVTVVLVTQAFCMLKLAFGPVLMQTQGFNSFILYSHVSFWKPKAPPVLSDNHRRFNRNETPLKTQIIIITRSNRNSKEKDYPLLLWQQQRNWWKSLWFPALKNIKSSPSLEHEKARMESDCAVQSRCHPSTSPWQDSDSGQLRSESARDLHIRDSEGKTAVIGSRVLSNVLAH